MKNADYKFIGIVGIVCGLLNIVPAFATTHWYRAACFLLLGIPVIVTALFTVPSSKPKMYRAHSWVALITGLAILALALSSFYASATLSAFNFVASVGLTVAGLYGLITCKTKYDIEVVP